MNGGLIKGGRGGVLAHIGEGKRDELVTPLPRNWQRGTQLPAGCPAGSADRCVGGARQ